MTDQNEVRGLQEVRMVRVRSSAPEIRTENDAEYESEQTDFRSRKERPVEQKPRKTWVRVLIWVFSIVLGLGSVAGAYFGYIIYVQFNDMTHKVSTYGDASNPVEIAPLEEQFEEAKTYLLLGMDTRKQTGSINTDVIMVCTVNPKRKVASLISIPRDALLMPDKHSFWKANSYFARYFNSDRQTAIEKVKADFGDYLDLKIDYVITLNFKAFEEIIDEFGGLTVDVDMDMRYVDSTDGTNIDLKKGIQELDGKQTLDFVRYRKSNRGTDESSDLMRNTRQQQVLRLLVDRVKSLDIVFHVGNILQSISEHMRTDIPANQIASLLLKYSEITKEQIQFFPINGEWRSPYIYIKDEDLTKAQTVLKSAQ